MSLLSPHPPTSSKHERSARRLLRDTRGRRASPAPPHADRRGRKTEGQRGSLYISSPGVPISACGRQGARVRLDRGSTADYTLVRPAASKKSKKPRQHRRRARTLSVGASYLPCRTNEQLESKRQWEVCETRHERRCFRTGVSRRSPGKPSEGRAINSGNNLGLLRLMHDKKAVAHEALTPHPSWILVPMPSILSPVCSSDSGSCAPMH